MKAPTPNACYYADICTAAGVTVKQVETWIQRKAFTPSNPTVPGRSRIFCRDDAVRLRIMAQLSKLGMPVDVAARVSEHLRTTFNGNLATLLGGAEASLFTVITINEAGHTLSLHTDLASLHRLVEQVSSAVTLNVTAIGRDAIDRLEKHILEVVARDEALRAAGFPAKALYDEEE